MASTYLTRTPGSSGNRKTYTFSLWFKRAQLSEQVIFNSTGGGIGEIRLNLLNDDLKFRDAQSGITKFEYITDRKFRDTSGWYHLVIAVDTTQATASDRVKFYINGVEETSFSTETNPDQNYDTTWNTANIFQIASNQNPGDYFDGSMSHVHFIDGTAYDADTFGETDATTGIWKPKTAPSVTYGTNGFFLKFENSGAFGTDSSGNGNNFTVNGTMTQTIDTPSNVFATLNPLWKETTSAGAMTYQHGNTTYNPNTNGNTFTRSTLGLSSGKYYIEIKTTKVNAGQASGMTIVPANEYGSSDGTGSYGLQMQFNSPDTDLKTKINGTTTTINSSFSSGSIAMMAVDLDNGKMWIGYNGTWYNNNNPSTTLDANNPDATGIDTSVDYLFGFQAYIDASSNYNISNVNFGNGYFGTTQVSSAQNPDDGIGIFEYAVPTGYKALCTKSINSQEYD